MGEHLTADGTRPKVVPSVAVGDSVEQPGLAAPKPVARRKASRSAKSMAQSPALPADEVDAARAEVVDRLMHAWQARFTASISPAALTLAFLDWGMHLANAPGKQAALVEKALRKW